MVEKIKYYYDKGLYKLSHMDVFLQKGILTKAQYKEITGQTAK